MSSLWPLDNRAHARLMPSLIAEVVASRRIPTPALARAIRETAGVSQARITEELGVTRMAVSR